MAIIITANGKDLKKPYSRTFAKAVDALERVEFLTPIAGRVDIRNDDGEELTVGHLRIMAQMERDGYL